MRKQVRNLYGKGISDYINEKGKPEVNELSKKYKTQVYEMIGAYKKTMVLLYYLMEEMGFSNLRQMFTSTQKSTHLLKVFIHTLSEYGVTDEWDKYLSRELTRSVNRVKYIRKITYENLRLTEDYCYFRAEGMKKLDGTILKPDMSDQLEEIKKGAEEYRKTHQEEIKKHMEEVQPLIDALNSERERNRQKDLEEKAERKRARKEAKEEVKEIKKNRERWAKLEKQPFDKQLAYMHKLEREANVNGKTV